MTWELLNADKRRVLTQFQTLPRSSLVGLLQCSYWLGKENKADKIHYWLPAVLKLARMLQLPCPSDDFLLKFSNEAFCIVIMQNISKYIQDQQLQKIKNSPYFSILVDNSAVTYNNNQLVSVFCRFFATRSKVETVYLGSLFANSQKGGINHYALIHFLHGLNLPFQNCVSFKPKDIVGHTVNDRSFFYFHFLSNALKFPLTLDIENIPYLKQFKWILFKIFNFLHDSQLCFELDSSMAALCQFIIKKIKGNEDRFALHTYFIDYITKNLPTLITCLEKAESEFDTKAAGILMLMKDPKFISSLIMFKDLIPLLNEVSSITKFPVLKWYPVEQSILKVKQKISNLFEKQKIELRQNALSQITQKFGIKWSLNGFDVFENETYVQFVKKIDDIFTNFLSNGTLLEAFTIFDPTSTLSESDKQDELKILTRYFCSYEEFDDAWDEYEILWPSIEKKSFKSVITDIAIDEYLYPVCSKLCKIAMVFPYKLNDCSEKIQALRRVKLDGATQVIVNDLLLISVEGPAINVLNFVELANYILQGNEKQ